MSVAALDALHDQPRVQALLSHALEQGGLSHAYLLVGPAGCGKGVAAQALSQCAVCPQGGCNACDECVRVAHRTHPDVHWLAPESAQGYLISQVREVVADASRAPIRATTKVYIFERAELLRGAAANALLKTLEEPPANTVFVLCATTVEGMLPTVVSRCQHVVFQFVAPSSAEAEIERHCACTPEEARMALSVAGTPSSAVDFLRSPTRQAARRRVVDALHSLPRADEWDVVTLADGLLEHVSAEEKVLAADQAAELEQVSDFLSASAKRQVGDANRRAISSRRRSAIMEVLAATESLLRDVLFRCEDSSAVLTNADRADVVDYLAAATSTSGVIAALAACTHAASDIDHNVSPQLTMEVMLLRIKEAL